MEASPHSEKNAITRLFFTISKKLQIVKKSLIINFSIFKIYIFSMTISLKYIFHYNTKPKIKSLTFITIPIITSYHLTIGVSFCPKICHGIWKNECRKTVASVQKLTPHFHFSSEQKSFIRTVKKWHSSCREHLCLFHAKIGLEYLVWLLAIAETFRILFNLSWNLTWM